jgi:hypothetical protein
VPGSMAVIVAPAGSASDLPNAGRDSAAGTFVAFGTATVSAPAGTAVHLVAGGELDLPPVGPPWAEAPLVARVRSNRASACRDWGTGDPAFLQLGSTRTLQGIGPAPPVVKVVAEPHCSTATVSGTYRQ